MALQAGQSLGNYQILSRIGVGGMGEVYLARHPLIGKNVALKVIHSDLSVNREVVERFVNEARAVSAIGNDHIVEIHDFGRTDDGAHFFIMEYLEGSTLARELGQWGVLPMERSLHIAAQIAAGLAATHRQRIVHRDLKPDNIMLVEKLGNADFVKILDFGLAKMLESSRQLTSAGVVLGTPEYMSPEAAESKTTVDARADIYSLGVLLFQMLTGRLPFTASTMGEVLVQQVCRAPPVPRGFNPNIPPAVEQIVLRCLAKKPEGRFQTMDELRAALLDPEGYLNGSPPMVASDATLGRPLQVGYQSERVPGLPAPQNATNKTMAIATPVGFVGRSRGRRAFIFTICVLMSAGLGSAVALVHPRLEAKAALAPPAAEKDAAAMASADPGQVTPPPLDAGARGPVEADRTVEPSHETVHTSAPHDQPEAEPKPAKAMVTLTSEPEGALVYMGELEVGATPTQVSVPADGRAIEFRFTHPGRRSVRKSIVVDRDTEVTASLRKRPSGDGLPKKKRIEDGMMLPDL